MLWNVARFEKLRTWIAQTVIVMEGWSAQAERTRVSAGFGIMVQLCYFSRFCVERSPLQNQTRAPARVSQREVNRGCPSWHEAAVWRGDLKAEDRMLQLHQFSRSCAEKRTCWRVAEARVLGQWSAQDERKEIPVSFDITPQLCLPSRSRHGVEVSPTRNETLVPARAVQREMSSLCSAWHDAEGWRRNVTIRNRVVPMLQVYRSCVEKCPRWTELPVPSLVMQRDASLSHTTWHDAAGWRRDSIVVEKLLHSSQLSCSRVESGPLRNAIVIQKQNGGNTQIERMRRMVGCRILSLWTQLPCSYVEWYSVRNETSVPARPSKWEVTLCCPAWRDTVHWWKKWTAGGIEPNPGPRRRSHCSAGHEAEVWRRDVTARNRVLPMLQVSRSCVEKCPMLQLRQYSRSCVEESPRWTEPPVPSLVMQRDASPKIQKWSAVSGAELEKEAKKQTGTAASVDGWSGDEVASFPLVIWDRIAMFFPGL